jgi:hypothetical protein
MPNDLVLNGGQPQKAVRFAPIYTGRWSSGIWTNRSPQRDANTTRLVEKFYGPSGDALIAGSNVEITNRLTLARRPGNSAFDANSWTAPDRFYSFRMFSSSSEQIDVMVDQATALYSLYNGVKTLVWTKSTGAGQSYMQSVGNSLYFGNGQDNKKWLQSLVVWSGGAKWNTPSTPFFSTFLIDPNGNIQQLTGTAIPISTIQVTSGVLTITSSATLTSVLAIGDSVTFPTTGMTATFLEGQTVTVTGVSGSTFTANFAHANYGPTADTGNISSLDGTPVSGSLPPTWSTVVPAAGNNYQGGITIDGTVQWTNRGNPIENWGIANDGKAVTPAVGTSNVSWQANTFYSLPGVIIDSNGNLQQVTAKGLSGGSTPTWATSVGNTTTDGSVTWKMIQTAASMVWTAHTAYTPSASLQLTSVANNSGGHTVYTGIITGGASNAFSGTTFVISGFTNAVNNGTYLCSASTGTTLTLVNALGTAETNAGTATTEGTYIIANAGGTNCLFQLAPAVNPTVSGNVSAYLYNNGTTGAVGCFQLTNPTSTGSALANTTTENSFSFGNAPLGSGATLLWNVLNGAGETTGTNSPFPSYTANYQLIILGSLNIPVAGQYTFSMVHHDGVIWGINSPATKVSGTLDNPIGQTITAAQGYTVMSGTNRGLGGGAEWTDTLTVNFPTAGVYAIEIDFAYWYHSGLQMILTCNGFPIANGAPESGTNPPAWPAWSTSYAPKYPTVTETNGQFTWINLGPTSDFVWAPETNFTLPNTPIIDPNGFTEYPYRTGISGTTAPTFLTGLNQLTLDNPNLIWINKGTASVAPSGTLSTFNGGWEYGVALVNTLDNTVSNMSPLSAATGNFIGVNGISIPAGAGLPALADIDPQSDYVAIFRTTDGGSVPFLIPGVNTTYTIPLSQYLVSGYTDTTPDTGLNNLIQGAAAGENTPPALGAINLTYHLNRIFFSIGNTVYWTSGPNTPVGNGVNGVSPLNYDNFPSLVKRLVPTTSGLMVFTVSDVYLIQGNGTSANPIQSGIPLMSGVGLLSYNALDVNGSIIGFFTTDNQFVVLDPSSGVDYAAFPIGDQLRLNNGNPGQSWNAANVYVAWHVSGEDQGWYICDGLNGWFRLMPTPAPESGYTWSPFATIVGGVGAVQSLEVSPGLHKLLLGPTGTGSILTRDLTTWEDNGNVYSANAVIGSAVLAQPGQIAIVSSITTDSVKTGTPLILGVIFDEALPYYKGAFDLIKNYVDDPPNTKKSTSFYSQRFNLSEIVGEAAACRSMQIKVIWSAENAQNELLTMTVYGAFCQES